MVLRRCRFFRPGDRFALHSIFTEAFWGDERPQFVSVFSLFFFPSGSPFFFLLPTFSPSGELNPQRGLAAYFSVFSLCLLGAVGFFQFDGYWSSRMVTSRNVLLPISFLDLPRVADWSCDSVFFYPPFFSPFPFSKRGLIENTSPFSEFLLRLVRQLDAQFVFPGGHLIMSAASCLSVGVLFFWGSRPFSTVFFPQGKFSFWSS